MSDASTPRLAGFIATTLAGALALSFPTGLGFAVVFAVTYGVGAWAFANRWDLWRSGNRWSGVLGGLVTFAALSGVQPLDIDPSIRFPVGLLVIGLGFASAGVAAEYVFRAVETGQITAPTAPACSDSDGQ
ncbi:hypothetical protein SAMN04487950_0212 [Halogranum rubrum]|uniref:Uncharacterized protein n=1 Tax=Halogranum rubrum TaxID=553466 RepID=A0A1I4B2E2_9EURY|nr:hypothetical protein [Halogranum rubrum]SFK62016.1 hypothetical protein SAMN04487950_0212 [Halogranum rubrum]